MSRLPVYALLLTAALSGAACGSDDDPTPPPSGQTPIEVVETITGPLTVNGAVTHSFPVERAGDITAVLTAVTGAGDTPPAISIALGTWNGVSCAIVVANDKATPPPAGTSPTAISSVIGRATVPGNFCLRVSDPGTLTVAVEYTVDLRHF